MMCGSIKYLEAEYLFVRVITKTKDAQDYIQDGDHTSRS